MYGIEQVNVSPTIRLEMVFCYQKCSDPLRKSCSSDRKNLMKIKAEGREFAKYLRSVEQSIETVKGQNNFW